MHIPTPLRLTAIAAIISALAITFLWLSGRAFSTRLTSIQVIDAIEANTALFPASAAATPRACASAGHFPGTVRAARCRGRGCSRKPGYLSPGGFPSAS